MPSSTWKVYPQNDELIIHAMEKCNNIVCFLIFLRPKFDYNNVFCWFSDG